MNEYIQNLMTVLPELVTPMMVLYTVLGIFGVLLLAFICLVAYAHLPFGAIKALEKQGAPDHIKKIGKKQFYISSLKAYVILIPDLLSPIVVPFLLLFTKREDEKLGSLNGIWGNDMSINGDVRTADDSELYTFSTDLNNQEEIAKCYWAKGHHPRSFYARWVWLGLRNRASMLNINLGKHVVRGNGPGAAFEFWSSNGTPWITYTDKWEWIVRKVNDTEGNPVVQIMSLEPLGENYTIRRYFGHKVPVSYKEWDMAMLAIVGWSLRKRKK